MPQFSFLLALKLQVIFWPWERGLGHKSKKALASHVNVKDDIIQIPVLVHVQLDAIFRLNSLWLGVTDSDSLPVAIPEIECDYETNESHGLEDHQGKETT